MLEFTVKYLQIGDRGEWRVTSHDDQYWTAKTIDDLPYCVRGLLRYQAAYIESLAKENEP